MASNQSASARGSQLRILIVGGSIAGLMSGILLRRKGYHVTILEQSSVSARSGLAAGIGLSGSVQAFLEQNDRLAAVPFGISRTSMDILDIDMNISRKISARTVMTTWDAIYYRLRANFDSFQSPYCLSPPPTPPIEGSADLRTGVRFTSIERSPNGRLLVTAQNSMTGKSETHEPDYVIGADGANSSVRRLLLPQLKRKEPGYCIWRGTVLVRNLSEETQNAIRSRTIIYQLRSSYVVVYLVPGYEGTLVEEEQHVNFAWYQYYKSAAELKSIMTDNDGHVHRTTLPKGKMRSEIWQEQVLRAKTSMHPIFYEIVDGIEAPFVSVISSITPSQAAFFDDRVFLIGDALFQVQPNTGQGSNMAAYGANTLCESIDNASKASSETKRRRAFRDWKMHILDRGKYEVMKSIVYANWLLGDYLRLVTSTFRMGIFVVGMRVAKVFRRLFARGRAKLDDGYIF